MPTKPKVEDAPVEPVVDQAPDEQPPVETAPPVDPPPDAPPVETAPAPEPSEVGYCRNPVCPQYDVETHLWKTVEEVPVRCGCGQNLVATPAQPAV